MVGRYLIVYQSILALIVKSYRCEIQGSCKDNIPYKSSILTSHYNEKQNCFIYRTQMHMLFYPTLLFYLERLPVVASGVSDAP